MPDRRRRLRS